MNIDYLYWCKYGIVGKLIYVRIVDMKNDIELICVILVLIWEWENLCLVFVILFDYEFVFVMCYVKWLYDDEMIEGYVNDGVGMEVLMVFVIDMIIVGYNFLGVLEDK